MSSFELKSGPSLSSSQVSASNLPLTMASELGSSSSSQDVTPVPAIALSQSQNEGLLPPNNCPNCKVLSRHLKISREWNNFFRLKLDQRDMLLHVAADYKRQKQRCLQLQMSLDQQSRECGEMRDQLTTLLLEVNPLKERVQIAEQAAKEEMVRREKAESNEYNLRFLVEQQAHKIKSFEDKFKPNLLEILERKLNLLRGEIKKLKQDNVHKSDVEWQLQQKASLVHAKQQRTLKKAHWGLSRAHMYGSHLLRQGQLPEGESSREWVRLKSVLKEVENSLHKQYLAVCQQVPVRPTKEAWLDDFSDEWQESEAGGEDSGAKQLERLIQDSSEDIISEEEEEEISEKKVEENFGRGNQQDCIRSNGISEYEETALVEPKAVLGNEMLCSRTQRKKDMPEGLITSILDLPAASSVSKSMHVSQSTAVEGPPHIVDRGDSEDGKIVSKSTSVLDRSAEYSETDLIPNTGDSKCGKVTKSITCMDTSAGNNESNFILNGHDSVSETTDTADKAKDTNNHVKLTSTVDITTKDIESDPLSNAGEAGHHSSGPQELTKQRSILDTSTEDSDEEVLPRSEECKADLAAQSLEMKRKRDTVELVRSAAPLDASMKSNEKDCHAGTDEPAPSVTSYHLDEELEAILQKMKPHEKLEDMDVSSSYSSEGLSHVVETDVHDPYMKQNLLTSLSDSEEEEQKMEMHNAEDENGVEISMPPRILTTQMSEGFSVASSHRDNSLHDDLDLSTDTPDPDDEKEEEKEIQKRVSMLRFPSTQSFSCDMEEGVLLSSSMQNPVFMAEEAEDGSSKKRQISCWPQLQLPGDEDDNNTGPITDTLKTQNKASLRELREMFGAVDDSATSDEKGLMDAKDRGRYIEEEEEGSSEDRERKIMKVAMIKTTEPQKHKKTGAVKGKNRKTVEECPIETFEETLENVIEATTGKEEKAEMEGKRRAEVKTQKNSEAEKRKKSGDKEDGKESLTNPKKGRTLGAKEERPIVTEEEKNREPAAGRTKDAVEEGTTVVKEKVEAMIKKATVNMEKITFDGQERMSEAVEDILFEKEGRSVAAVVERSVEIIKERTADNVEEILISEEERITNALKGSTTVVVEKPPLVEKEGTTEIMKEKVPYTLEEKRKDIVVEKIYETVGKRTTENVEKTIKEIVGQRTTVGVESIPVNVQERSKKVLKEKNTGHADERTAKEKTAFSKEKRCIDERLNNEAIQERTMSTLENNNVDEGNNTKATEDRSILIDIDNESSSVPEKRNCDTSEQEATGAVEEENREYMEQRIADPVLERMTDAGEDRSTVAMEGQASKTTEGIHYETARNRNIAVVVERMTKTVTIRNSNTAVGKSCETLGERTHRTVEERAMQILEGRTMKFTNVEERNAEAVEESNTDVEEEDARAEEQVDIEIEEDNAQAAKRMMRKKVISLMQRKGNKEEQGKDNQEVSCWKNKLRRQRKFDWESEEVNQEGRKLRGCIMRRMVEKAKLNKERKEREQGKKRRNKRPEMEERKKKIKPEEENTCKKKENRRKQEEKVMKEKSKKQGKEGTLIKQKDSEKEELTRGKKQNNEGKIKKSEIEIRRKNKEERRREVVEKKKTLDDNGMKQVEEEINEGKKKGRKHEQENKTEEEDKEKEVEESRRKDKEIKKKERKEEITQEEKEIERKEEERKRMEEKRRSLQEEKKQEHKKLEEEEGKLCTHDLEEKGKSKLNQKEGKERIKEKESQNLEMWKGGTTKETQGYGLFGHFSNTSKGQERIVFSWSLRKTERRKLTKFNKWGKLTRVIPDPLGSLRHSVFTMEGRIQCNEEQQGNRKGRKTKQPGAELQEIHEGQMMCCKDRSIGKENNSERTNNSVIERVSGGMMKETRDEIIKENRKNYTGDDNAARNEKTFKIGNRKRNSSSSSDKELQIRNVAPQQCITHPRNAPASISGSKASHTTGLRQLKAKASKVNLFGLDSSNSSEAEEEKTVVKKRRKFKEKEQQHLQSLAHNQNKYCRSLVPLDSTVSEKMKPIEQVQTNKIRKLSSSSSCSLSTSYVTNDSGEESITEERSPKQSSWNQENHSNTSSESDISQPPLTRKCKALLIVSDTDDHEVDSSTSAIFQKKRRRKRKVRINDNIVNEEWDCSSDSDHSSSEQKRHVADHITPKRPSAHARTLTEMQRKVGEESCVDICPIPLATEGAIPHILQRKAFVVSPGKQEKDSLSDERRFEVVPKECTGQHSFSQKQQNNKETMPQIDYKPNMTIESPLTSKSLNQKARLHYGLQITKGRARKLRKDRPAEKTTSTCSHTSKRSHSVLLSATPSQSCKRQKGSSSPFSQAFTEVRADSINTIDGQEEDTLLLPKMKRDSFMLLDEEKDAQLQGESMTQVLLNSNDQDQNSSVMGPESEEDNDLVIEDNFINCSDTAMSNLSSQNTSVETQEGLVQRVSRLGPVVFIARPKFKPKPGPSPKLAPQTPVPAGPEYIDRLFSKLNQRTGVCSELNQSSEISSLSTQGTHSSALAEGTCSQNQSHLTHYSRGVDYQGQYPVLLPNIYGTLHPAAATVTSLSQRHSPDFSLAHSEPTKCQPFQHMSSFISSTREAKVNQTSSTLSHTHPMPDYPNPPLGLHPTHDQLQPTPTQPHSTPLKPSPTHGQPQSIPSHPHHTHVQPHPLSSHHHHTHGHPHLTPGQPLSTLGHPIPSQPFQCSVPELQHVSWLPEIVTERVIHSGKRRQRRSVPVAVEYLKETLEGIVASRVQSKWWVRGLREICASITNTTLPAFLRLVLESILRSDPLEPQEHKNSLPPRLFRLFQVVCVVEQRLTPQHPSSLRSALLRAIQGIVMHSHIRIRPHSLASLTAWYVASVSLESQQEAGHELGRGRAFLVDLLFHRPGTAHLAILTAANTCSRLFLRHVHYRELSGLEQVVVWLAHYGAWIGRPGVRSDLTKWLAQHLNSKKPPQSPATLAKNLITLLQPGNNKDQQWGAAAGLVVLTRWQGRPWAQKHLLPALTAATAKITTIDSQDEDPDRDMTLHDDLKNKNSHLFGKLGRALVCGPEESETGDVVKKMEDAVNTLLCFHQ